MQDASYLQKQARKIEYNLDIFSMRWSELTNDGMEVDAHWLIFSFFLDYLMSSHLIPERLRHCWTVAEEPLHRQRHASVRRVLDSWRGRTGCCYPITINAAINATGHQLDHI